MVAGVGATLGGLTLSILGPTVYDQGNSQTSDVAWHEKHTQGVAMGISGAGIAAVGLAAIAVGVVLLTVSRDAVSHASLWLSATSSGIVAGGAF